MSKPLFSERKVKVNALIVGLNHQIQRAEMLSGGDDIEKLEREQKAHFAEYVARVIEERKISLVGEEAQHGVPLVAGRVANDLKCCHANIEMSPEVRAIRQIPTDYTRNDRGYSPEQRAAWHREREQYMVDQILRSAGHGSVAVFCGREHTESLANILRAGGHSVDTYDLNCEAWYVEDWLMHILAS